METGITGEAPAQSLDLAPRPLVSDGEHRLPRVLPRGRKRRRDSSEVEGDLSSGRPSPLGFPARHGPRNLAIHRYPVRMGPRGHRKRKDRFRKGSGRTDSSRQNTTGRFSTLTSRSWSRVCALHLSAKTDNTYHFNHRSGKYGRRVPPSGREHRLRPTGLAPCSMGGGIWWFPSLSAPVPPVLPRRVPRQFPTLRLKLYGPRLPLRRGSKEVPSG